MSCAPISSATREHASPSSSGAARTRRQSGHPALQLAVDAPAGVHGTAPAQGLPGEAVRRTAPLFLSIEIWLFRSFGEAGEEPFSNLQ